MFTTIKIGATRIAAGLVLFGFMGFAHAQDSSQLMEEVIVTGTQIKGASISEALPVSVLDEEALEALGVNSGDELLEYLAEQGQNQFNEAENISGGVNAARGDIGAFNLRNLGTGNTLVLLNGRRVVNAASYQTELVGGSFVPVNTANSQSMPVLGLRRLEVLRDGASAIYGADAVAGVVNYVTSNDFEGLSLRVRVDDYESLPRDDARFTIKAGKMFNEERTRVGLFVNYYDRDSVNAQDDPRWADSDFRRRLDANSPWASVTSFRNNSANSEYGQFDLIGADFGGLTDSRGEFETYPTGDARCQYELGNGTCAAVDGQGTYRHNLNSNRDLISDLKRTNVYAYLNHDFENGMESFTEVTAYISKTDLVRHGSAKLGAVARHEIAADYFYNPFGPCGSASRIPEADAAGVPCTGVEMQVDNYRVIAPRYVENDGDTYRVLSGLRGTWQEWDWEGAITWSRATKEDTTERVSNNLFDAALRNTTAGGFNIFAGPDADFSSLLVDVHRDNETDLFMIDFKASHPSLFDLPAGPVGFVAGVEYREESFEDDRDPRLDGGIPYIDNSGNTFPFVSDVMNSSPSADSDGDRDVTSAYIEFQIPVFESLDVQAALRYEDFSDVGDTTVGKFAFGWRPIDQILLRGSWSQAFRAPNLVTVNESAVARSNTLDDLACLYADPTETTLDCTYSMQRTAQGSSDLVAEESDNWNLGLVLEPIEGLVITYDFWEIEKEDTIGLFGERNHLALELLNLINAGTGSCGTTVGSSSVVRDASDPAEDALYLAAGICPQGIVQRVDDRYQNLDTRTIKGQDIGIFYDFETPIGEFSLSLNGTFLDEYEQAAGGDSSVLLNAQAMGVLPATVPVVGFADLIRQNGNAESKYTARAHWRKGQWAARISGVRYGDFVQTSLTLSDGSEWVVDEMETFNFSIDYSFGFNDIATRVRLGINNITDERAPLADRFFGYYADQHRDFGRSFYLDVKVDI